MSDHSPKGHPLPAEIRHELARAVERLGEREVSAAIGHPATVARAIAGLRVYRTTHAAVRAFVERLQPY